jgi:hypothetical protein
LYILVVGGMNRKWMIGVSFLITLILVVSGDVVAVGPGADTGEIGSLDSFWDSDWSCVYEHSDSVQGTWWTGASFWDVYYRNLWIGPPNQDGFNLFFKDVTVPWIGIKMTNGTMTYYDFNDKESQGGSMDNHLMFSGPWDQNGDFNGLAEADNQAWLNGQPNPPNVPGTDLDVRYSLDINGDETVDFSFLFEYSVQGDLGVGRGGQVILRICLIDYPVDGLEMGYGWDTLDSIEYAYMFDPDVHDDTDNEIYWYATNQWSKLDTEAGPLNSVGDASGYVAYFTDGPRRLYLSIGDPLVDVIQTFYALASHGNEYSRHPSNYDNNEDIDDEDGLVWVVETYDCQQDLPPHEQNGQPAWSYVQFDGLCA